MNNKTVFLIIAIALLSASFLSGYFLGKSSSLDEHYSYFKQSLNLESDEQNAFLSEPSKGEPNKKATNPAGKTDTNPQSSNAKNKDKLSKESLTNEEDENAHKIAQIKAMQEAGELIPLIEYLISVSNSGDHETAKLYRPIITSLKEMVESDLSYQTLMTDYLLDVSTDSKAHIYIASILLGTDNAKPALMDIVDRLRPIGSTESNEKLLYLISSGGLHYDNPAMTETLKDIALYNLDSEENRLYALELLMPYQLSNTEKANVVTDFTQVLSNTSDDQKSYIVENIMRYSEPAARIELANNYLMADVDFGTRVAVLSSLHSGIIKPNAQLKDKLFNIAQSNNDPLNKHAKNALMYLFEIDNEEYKALVSIDNSRL